MRWISRRDRAEQDLHDELQTFIDMAADDEVRDGAAAWRVARRGRASGEPYFTISTSLI